MYYKRIPLALFLFVSLQSAANVTINVNNTVYDYTSNPRMAEVLEPVALEQSWYWNASKLFRLDNVIQVEQKKEALRVLSSLLEEQSFSGELERLKQELRDWYVLSRVNTPIDFELSRLMNEYNPRFENGSYKLLLSTRPNHILFFGALSETLLPYENETAIDEYFKQLNIPKDAYVKGIVVIAPNGDKKLLSNYLSTLAFEPMPGSLVFIPFNESRNNNIALLNHLLLELSEHRVLH
ncbi:capsule biosynthesis GfcC family protein [Agaribacter marinus]|uniref:Capsule biosynthesis GfcC n=1 Tax=Agaribacter marinus TaxID=1431249 RepID=A0AA37T421_9ALTE|nr:capsule biosynthesis GfcC family protein [Agaribacter marinus]GLR71125.1 hypothetical protein GCM10007852_20330 [Agaribacter marinus]